MSSNKKVDVSWLNQTETNLRNTTILAPLYVLPNIHIEGICTKAGLVKQHSKP